MDLKYGYKNKYKNVLKLLKPTVTNSSKFTLKTFKN